MSSARVSLPGVNARPPNALGFSRGARRRASMLRRAASRLFGSGGADWRSLLVALHGPRRLAASSICPTHGLCRSRFAKSVWSSPFLGFRSLALACAARDGSFQFKNQRYAS